MTAPTLDLLLARIYRHFPKNIPAGDPRHQASEESRRLACVYEAAAKACNKGFVPVPDAERVEPDPEVRAVVDALRAWPAFVERCGRAFPDRVVWDRSGPFFDPGYRVSVAQAGFVPPPRTSETGAAPASPPPAGKGPLHAHDPVVCMVSVLAPVYAIVTFAHGPGPYTNACYADFSARYHDRIGTLCALAEEFFGFSRLGADMLLFPVPGVQPHASNRLISDTILSDCLFTTIA